jgi:N-acetylglutamate synthase-like GNAT family acetyltransferase
MSRPLAERQDAEVFGEKEFYLEEFRGRSVLVAVAPEAIEHRVSLDPLAGAVADLARNDTRVLLWWPAGATGERRLRAALGRARVLVRERVARRGAAAVLRSAAAADGDPDALRAALWSRLRRTRMCVYVAGGAARQGFPHHPATLAIGLGVPKLVLLDPGGGLLTPGRLSFADEHVLDTVLRQGEAEWSGLGERRILLAAVREALRGGVESVNLCAPERVGEELFTYEGAGTLFTPGDYCRVAPLALDDFAQAERLIERGQREGILKLRSPQEIAQTLAVAHGAKVYGRQLAGVAGLLTAPYAAERAGEIAGLYTITRFKGEGIGDRLVTCLLAEAERQGLAYVFACAVDARAQQFFGRLGFERVRANQVPEVKWAGYDPRRLSRVVVFQRRLTADTAAARA